MRVLIATLLLALAELCAIEARAAPSAEYDLIITNGRIVDGSGNPWFRADIGIRGAKIAAIGRLDGATAHRRIDARQQIVAPGFIDMNSQTSWEYLVDSRAVSKLTQGITLEVTGEGESVAPLDEKSAARLAPALARFHVEGRWRSLEDFFDLLGKHPATINFASFIGTQTVRELSVGFEQRPAQPAELNRMREVVDLGMRQGALGIFSSLRYSPDRFNSTDELIAMAAVAGKYGGIYETHPRSEANAVDESMDEVMRIARSAAIPAHITHLKSAYKPNWGKMGHIVERIDAARREGLDVTSDIYPYTWAGGTFTAMLPPWAQDGGRESIVRRLNDPTTRERIKMELGQSRDDWENEYLGAGPEGLKFIDASGNAKLQKYVGRTLADIASGEHRDPRDVMMDIILAGDGSVISRIMSEDDIRRAMVEPWLAFCTDAAAVAPDGPLAGGMVHPRAYGTFPRIFAEYVRRLKLIQLEEAVRRATSLPAQRLSIRDRGLLQEGFYADIVIFDPQTIADTATYEKPAQLAVGIDYVLVNGQIVLENGKITAARPGQVVRGPGYRAGTR